MRIPAHRLLLPAALLILAACSDQKKAPTETAAPAQTPPRPDTTVSATPAAPARPDTAYVHDVAAYLAGQPVSSASNLQPLTAETGLAGFRHRRR